jgi:predicted O-methyltransferase YrrM
LYSPLLLARKYVKYYFTASNGKGHGVHSPFVFEFIKLVLNDKKIYPCYEKIEAVRRKLLADYSIIEVEDFGAGSTVMKTKSRKISAIAHSSLKPKRFSRLLFRMIQFYKLNNILELGTSLGVTTSYLASANNNPVVTTMEGSKTIAQIAQQNFIELGLSNINLITGDFAATLAPYLSAQQKIDLAFVDGNHRKQPTLDYFKKILSSSHEKTILVFDDIHWSKEMEDAWEEIKLSDAVTLTIDLFFIGIVLLRKDFKVKQHFTVRF